MWAYYRFVKGRTFKPNLESAIVGEAIRDGDFINLIATMTVKNIGASKVDIQHRHTVFRVLAAKVDSAFDAFEVIGWEHLDTRFAFEADSHLEPGQTATDTHLFRVPGFGQIAFKLEIYISSNKGDLWVNASIVNMAPKSDNGS